MHSTVSIELSEKDVKTLSLGQKITVTIEGTVDELRAGGSYDVGVPVGGGESDGKKETYPARMDVKYSGKPSFKAKPMKGKNDFTDMSLEDDED